MKKSQIIVIICSFILLAGGIIVLNKKSGKDTVLIGLGGDTMLGRLTNQIIKQNGCTYVWGNLLSTMQSTDFNFVNLETTLTKSFRKVPKAFNFKSDPEHAVCLTLANIQGVNLANNHMLDFDTEGLLETIETLNKVNIKHVGAGKNLEEAKVPIIIEKNGIKIGFLGYADYPEEWAALKDEPGINFIRIGDIQRIKKDITKLKKQADFIILSIHWGPNMRERPTQEFITFAHAIIDAGVDLFHGHSAHIFQGIEQYKGKLIFYDMGELIDDYAVDPILRNDRSIFGLVTIDKHNIKNFKLVPIVIDHMQVNKAEGEDYQWIAERIKKLSNEFNTDIQFYKN